MPAFHFCAELICFSFLLMTPDRSDIRVLIGGWIRSQRLAGDQAHRGTFEMVRALGGGIGTRQASFL